MNTVEVSETKNIVTITESKGFVNLSDEANNNISIGADLSLVTIQPETSNLVSVSETPSTIQLSGESTETIEIMTVGAQGPAAPEYIGPAFTYNVDGTLSRIDYNDGSYKLFTYSSGILDQINFFIFGGDTIRKSFNYSGGVLSSIDQVTL